MLTFERKAELVAQLLALTSIERLEILDAVCAALQAECRIELTPQAEARRLMAEGARRG